MISPIVVEYPLGDNPPKATLYYGIDVIEGLRLLPDKSVHTCCTSPPYWALRNYGVDGQLGMEQTPEEYVAKMVEVFREVKRVLRDDGTLWLNLGDTYYGGGSTTEHGQDPRNYSDKCNLESKPTEGQCTRPLKPHKHPTLRTKDACGIPWMTAFALRADGWYLRSDIIWSKKSCMPEAVTDRPTKSHEYIFLLTKNSQYFYDQDAIREPLQDSTVACLERRKGKDQLKLKKGVDATRNDGDNLDYCGDVEKGRNKRTVWTISLGSYAGAHFATWPEKLVEVMVKAGSSEKGCCSKCGAPRRRVVGKSRRPDGKDYEGKNLTTHPQSATRRLLMNARAARSAGNAHDHPFSVPITTGWEPTCECGADSVPCVVLDPFSGSATTGAVSMRLGRNYIGIDLQESYLTLACARLRGEVAPQEDDDPLPEGDDTLSLFT